jgi:type I restriction enzyme S subunit
MPQNWNIYKLGDLCTNVYSGGTPSTTKTEYYDGEIPWLNTKEVDFKSIYSTEKFITEEGLKKSSAKWVPKNAVVIAMYGNTAGKSAITKIPLTTNQACCNLIVDDKIADYRFVYYYVLNDYELIKDLSVGGAQQNLNAGTIKNYEVKLPPLPEQTAIASILSALDDKIELNLQQNKTLEEMAMALYKHWFVDFGPFKDGKFVESELGRIPEGWEVKRLNEIAQNKTTTFNFKGREDVVFVNTGDVQEGRFLHSNRSQSTSLPGQAKKAIAPGDILYSEIRPKNKRFAFVNFDSSDYVVSTKFMIIKPIEGKINNRLLYRILTKQDTVDHFNMIADGRSGTFPQITFDAISEYLIALPCIEIQNEFQRLVESFELKQDVLFNENQNLTQLRYSLLPKLISGEVRVKNIEPQINAIA